MSFRSLLMAALALGFLCYCLPDPADCSVDFPLVHIVLQNLAVARRAAHQAATELQSTAHILCRIPYGDHFSNLLLNLQQLYSAGHDGIASFTKTMAVVEKGLAAMMDASTAKTLTYLMYATAILSIYRVLDTIITMFEAVLVMIKLFIIMPFSLLFRALRYIT